MAKNIFELDPERLATTDEHGHRVYLYPEDVKGVWKTRRTYFYWFLILIYLVLPWFNINGKPALMLNIFTREFTVMGFTLHGVEPILFFLLVASALFFIGFITSLFGRVWCGWACPQTVFIQSIFMKIDSFFEGKARARRELDKAPWTLNKFLRRSGKWITFTLISLHISHTFVGYFIGPRNLFEITMHSPLENWGIFLATMILTGIFLLDFGWFREQFCIIACPYGRMQSVIMDENSLVVSYNGKRGEPRRNPGVVTKEDEGDCINCYNCVKVCPTGIDIRRGTQLECIACTQCIDACDEIMTKLKRPTGLIKYSSENEIQGKKRKVITLRSGIYVSISLSLIAAFIYFLNASTNLNLVFLRSKIPFTVTDGRVLNNFKLKISHQGSDKYNVVFKVNHADVQIVTNLNPVVVDVPEKKIVVFFRFDQSILVNGTKKVIVHAIEADTLKVLTSKEVTLVGPTH